MNFSYYPGCTLKTKAKELDVYAKKCAEVLDFSLTEIEDWQCCGGVYPLSKDEIATKLSSVRALNAAKEKGEDLVTVCSACHHVIKRVNNDIKTDSSIREKANNYMGLDEAYKGETNVLHYLEVLRAVQFSCSVVSNSLRPHESQHARPPCPSPTPGVHVHRVSDAIQPSHPLSSPSPPAPPSLPASGSFPMSQLFA